MANVIPFRAVRPVRSRVHLVASRAFYTYPKHVLEAKLDSNPYSFIHIINPEFREVEKSEPNSIERFQKVRERYDAFLEERTLIKEESDAFYIYQQSGEYTYTGIIGGASSEDYNSDVIKKHEDTLTRREEVFKLYLDICSFNAEPVLMMHEDNQDITAIIEKYTKTRAEYEFATTDLITHLIWVVKDPNDIETIRSSYAQMNSLYIADGHHRSASSALFSKDRLASHGDSNNPDQYFMSYFLPESELQIFPFHRLVKDLDGLSTNDLLDKLKTNFDIIEESEYVLEPNKPREFVLATSDKSYRLQFMGEPTSNNPVDVLDAKILSDKVLGPMLDIFDLKTSDRIDFVGGPTATFGVEQELKKGRYKVAFLLYSVTKAQLKAVANAGLTMPPKSTWMEPKLRSGLTIYEM